MKTKAKAKPRNSKAAPRKRGKKGKSAVVFTMLSVGAAGVLGFLCWQYVKKRRRAKNSELDTLLTTQSGNAVYPSSNINTATPPYMDIPSSIDTSSPKTVNPLPGSVKSTGSAGFPLKKGAKGENVRNFQQALIAKYGASILPRYGADGDFGSETVAALKKAGLPSTIDESTFNVLVQGSSGSIDPSALAMKLLEAAARSDYNTAISNLKKLRSKDDYQQVSNVFSQYKLGLVRKTLVTGMLDAFTNESQKQAIRFEFIRMGLKYDGNKWSLSGFDGRPIVTTESTAVWINATESVQVPANMVLGAEVTRRLDYTLFENNNKHFLVSSRSIRYL